MNTFDIVDPLKEYKEAELERIKMSAAMADTTKLNMTFKIFCQRQYLQIYKNSFGFRRFFLLDWWKLKFGF